MGSASERTKSKTAVCSEMGGQGCWVASRQTTIIDHDNFLARQTIGSPRSQELDLRLPARKLTLCADQECGAYNRGRRRRNPSRRLLGMELGYHFSRLRLFEEGRADKRMRARKCEIRERLKEFPLPVWRRSGRTRTGSRSGTDPI